MEFDWNNPPFELGSLTQREIEESFEDSFAIRLLPDSPRFGVQARFFNLGMSAGGQGIVSVYRTSGRSIKLWPEMTPGSNLVKPSQTKFLSCKLLPVGKMCRSSTARMRRRIS